MAKKLTEEEIKVNDETAEKIIKKETKPSFGEWCKENLIEKPKRFVKKQITEHPVRTVSIVTGFGTLVGGIAGYVLHDTIEDKFGPAPVEGDDFLINPESTLMDSNSESNTDEV